MYNSVFCLVRADSRRYAVRVQHAPRAKPSAEHAAANSAAAAGGGVKQVVRLALSPRAQAVVAQLKRETGITRVAFLERLLEWYAAQDARVRSMILSAYPEVRRGLCQLIMEEMTAHPGKDFDALPRFDGLIDHDFGSGADDETAAPPRRGAAAPGEHKGRRRRSAR